MHADFNPKGGSYSAYRPETGHREITSEEPVHAARMHAGTSGNGRDGHAKIMPAPVQNFEQFGSIHIALNVSDIF